MDCETLVHGVAVYFGIEHIKGQAITSGFARDVAHDIQVFHFSCIVQNVVLKS